MRHRILEPSRFYTHTLAQVVRDLRQRRCFRHLKPFFLGAVREVTRVEEATVRDYERYALQEKWTDDYTRHHNPSWYMPGDGWYPERYRGRRVNPAIKFWKDHPGNWEALASYRDGSYSYPEIDRVGLYDYGEVSDRIAQAYGMICDVCGEWDEFGRPWELLSNEGVLVDICHRCWCFFHTWRGKQEERLESKGREVVETGFEEWLAMRLREAAKKRRVALKMGLRPPSHPAIELPGYWSPPPESLLSTPAV